MWILHPHPYLHIAKVEYNASCPFSSRTSFFWSNTNPPCGLPQASQYLEPFFLLPFFTSAISQHCLGSQHQYSTVRVSNSCLFYFWNFRGKSTLLTKERQERLMTDIETWVNSHTRSQIIINGIVTTGIELRACRFQLINGPSTNNKARICFKTMQLGLLMGNRWNKVPTVLL